MDAQGGQEVPGDDLAVEMYRLCHASQCQPGVMVGDEMVEGAVLRTPVEEVGIRDVAAFRSVFVARLHFDKPLRLEVWGRTQHDRIHDAEDGGVGANTQRERDHHH